METNGNGSRTINRNTQITLGVVIMLVTLLVGAVSYAAGQGQLLTSHISDASIHMGIADRARVTQNTAMLENLTENMRDVKTDIAALREELRR